MFRWCAKRADVNGMATGRSGVYRSFARLRAVRWWSDSGDGSRCGRDGAGYCGCGVQRLFAPRLHYMIHVRRWSSRQGSAYRGCSVPSLSAGYVQRGRRRRARILRLWALGVWAYGRIRDYCSARGTEAPPRTLLCTADRIGYRFIGPL